jgi:hypothetical protein
VPPPPPPADLTSLQSDADHVGKLTPAQFYHAVKLAAVRQAGGELSLASLGQPAPLPCFNGVDLAPPPPPATTPLAAAAPAPAPAHAPVGSPVAELEAVSGLSLGGGGVGGGYMEVIATASPSPTVGLVDADVAQRELGKASLFFT